MAASPRIVHLQAGDIAPTVRVTDVLGRRIAVAEQPHRFVLLAFLRYSDCPWCNLAIHRLALEYPTFLAHDCEIITFVQSARQPIIKNIIERHAVKPQFPIVADPERRFYKRFGVRSSLVAAARSITKIPSWVHAVKGEGFSQHSIDGKNFLVPAYFLIDVRSGKIVHADYGKSFYDHDTFVDLYESLFFRSY